MSDSLMPCLSKLWDRISPAIKAHLWVIFTLVISLLFSLLPLMVGAAVEATRSNIELMLVFKSLLLKDAMFIYCASYIAPLVLLTFTMIFKKKRGNYMFYPLALIGSLYVLIIGSLMYSGVVARNLYSLGSSVEVIQFPTLADNSILIVTLCVWYYCMFKESYVPNDAIYNYEDYRAESFKKFDGVAKK